MFYKKLLKKIQTNCPYFGQVLTNNNNAFKYLELDFETKKYFLDEFIPKKYHSDFNVKGAEIIRDLPVHTDNGSKTNINLYFNAQNCRTRFFKNIGEPVISKVFGTGVFYKGYTGFVEVDYFVAQDSDIYVLDVSEPHSVNFITSNDSSRYSVTILTPRYTFLEVLEILNENGIT